MVPASAQRRGEQLNCVAFAPNAPRGAFRAQEYMAQVGGRNDSRLFTTVVLIFLVPALTILGWAYFSGYLTPNMAAYSSF